MSAPYYPPAGYPTQPPRRKGMGCFAIGCLVVAILMVVGVVSLGGFGWWMYSSNIKPFIGSAPVPIHAYQADPARYTDLTNRFEKFMGSLQAGQAATLALSADDLNTAVAFAPGAEKIRGKMYFNVVGDELVVETSYPVPSNDRPGASTMYYFNGRFYLAASFSAGDFAFLIRKVETLDGKTTPPLVAKMLANPDFNRGFNEGLNREFNKAVRQGIDRDPNAAAVLNRVRTVVVQNGQVILTSAEGQPMSAP